MGELPLIFSHYGNIDYLSKSMLCASLTNPSKRKILIGDSSNRDSALSNGWEHINFDNINSDLRTQFNKNFKYVRGSHHTIVKNQGDWLRYVFERWYFIEQFCQEYGILQFWHFDSDVMLLEDLRLFETTLSANYDFTCQCSGSCLNGLVKLDVLSDYCQHIIELFKDEKFISTQQHEFDTVNPHYAFTEMRAYTSFSNTPNFNPKNAHLESIFKGWWFDDCICEDDGCTMEMHSTALRPIKKVSFRDGAFLGIHENKEVRFAVINLSWVPTIFFDWFISCILSRQNKNAVVPSELIAWPIN